MGKISQETLAEMIGTTRRWVAPSFPKPAQGTTLTKNRWAPNRSPGEPGLRAKSENVGSSRFLDAGLDGLCRRGWGGSIDTRRAVDGRLEHVAVSTAEAVRQAIIGVPARQP